MSSLFFSLFDSSASHSFLPGFFSCFIFNILILLVKKEKIYCCVLFIEITCLLRFLSYIFLLFRFSFRYLIECRKIHIQKQSVYRKNKKHSWKKRARRRRVDKTKHMSEYVDEYVYTFIYLCIIFIFTCTHIENIDVYIQRNEWILYVNYVFKNALLFFSFLYIKWVYKVDFFILKCSFILLSYNFKNFLSY